MKPKHPHQPLYVDDHGTIRFHPNKIVDKLLDVASNAKLYDMNRIVMAHEMGEFSKDDLIQFYQLIGYSVGGYSELSRVSNKEYARAEAESEKLEALSKRKRKKYDREHPPILHTYELMRANKEPDSMGHIFTPECLKAAVEEWEKKKGNRLVCHKYDLLKPQGVMNRLWFDDAEQAINAEVEILYCDTAKLVRDNPDGFELALGGRVEENDILMPKVDVLGSTEAVSMVPVKVINRISITGAALVPVGEKIK